MEELPLRAPGIHVSLVVNRRQRAARVVDFLSGAFPQKAAALDAFARREGIERLFTLVEREESHGWARVGFLREGSIPGYYKRSDAHLMGRVVTTPPLLDDDGAPLTVPADANAAERALNQAKRQLAEVSTLPRAFKTSVLSEAELLAAGLQPPRSRKAGAWLDERFGRSGERLHVVGRVAKGNDQLVSLELQEPFGNAYLQLAQWAPRLDDARVLFGALLAATEALRGREIGCVFTHAPVEATMTSAALLAAGFKRTGLLSRHLLQGDERCDALLWTRRAGGADAISA